jgi:hypothetical protein
MPIRAYLILFDSFVTVECAGENEANEHSSETPQSSRTRDRGEPEEEFSPMKKKEAK